MLKPRKLKNRYQVTKQTTSRTSRAQAVVIYGGKKKLLHLAFEKIRKINKEVEPMLLNPNGRKDFFMLRRVIKDIFRMTQGEWILSWLDNRRELYFHRKFPRPKPFELSQEAMDSFLNIGINANKEQVSADTYVHRKLGLVRQALAKHVVDTDVSEVYNWTTLSVQQIAELTGKTYGKNGLAELGFADLCIETRDNALNKVNHDLQDGSIDNFLFLNSLHQWRDDLPRFTAFVLYNPLLRVPAVDELIEEVLAKAQERWDAGETFGLPNLTKYNLAEWVIKYGESKRPKLVDYLSQLTTGDEQPYLKQLFGQMRGLSKDVNIEMITGDLASKPAISDTMLVSTPDRDGGFYYRAIKERKPGDGSIQISIDSLPQSDKKDDEDA